VERGYNYLGDLGIVDFLCFNCLVQKYKLCLVHRQDASVHGFISIPEVLNGEQGRLVLREFVYKSDEVCLEVLEGFILLSHNVRELVAFVDVGVVDFLFNVQLRIRLEHAFVLTLDLGDGVIVGVDVEHFLLDLFGLGVTLVRGGQVVLEGVAAFAFHDFGDCL